MKKTLFALLLLTIFFVGINVKAKYSSYKAGDVIIINDHYFFIIEDSDSNTEKLKLMDTNPIMVSNMEEIMDECSVYNEDDDDDDIQLEAIYNSPPIIDVQCVTEHANLCTEEDDECYPLMLPFESRELEEDEELVYDENSSTNIGYFMKNKLNNYYKNLLGYNNVKTRLITADEQISYFIKTDMMIGGALMSRYGYFSNYECNNGHPGGVVKNNLKSSREMTISNVNYPIFGEYLVNSLKYTGECRELVGYTDDDGDVYTLPYMFPSGIKPVIEVSKKEFSYELTKEKEGDGTLELETNNNYKAGDFVIVNEKPYVIIGNKNGQVRLISTMPVAVSNYDEIEEECERYFENYNSDNTELVNCIIEHANYCSNLMENNCEPLTLPFNYDDISNHTYNPNLETNVGHYIKNELKDIIQEGFGDKINIIDVDVLTYDEMTELSESGIVPIFPVGTVRPDSKKLALSPSNISMQSTPSKRALGPAQYLYLILNYNDNLDELDYAITDFGKIYPVITVSVDDLPVNAKAGSTVTVTTEPEEGYELVELTVTDDDNNKVIYTPSDLVRRERGTYTFKMTSANAHVYAKFIPIQTYSAKSLSEELTIDDGLDKLSGTSVKYRIRLNAGDTLKGIVYYDEERNEVEVPFEEENGEYTFDMPAMNVFLRAIIQYADPVYNLYGMDVTIPVQKSEEGGTLTFTVNGTKKVDKIVYKDEEGNEIYPYYSVKNGVYSVIMPANDVYVEITYLEEQQVAPTPDKEETPTPDEEHISTPITVDSIIKSVTIFAIGFIIFMTCVVTLKKRKPRKKVLIPYDMV